MLNSKGNLFAIALNQISLVAILNTGKRCLFRDGTIWKILPENKITDFSTRVKDKLDKLNSFDVVEVYSENAIWVCYSSNFNDNALFVTNKCNSSCIMCPCSDAFRKEEARETIEHICSLIDYMPSDAKHITITGGEPTLLRKGFIQIASKMKLHFEGTKFLLLTNGRTFSNQYFTEEVLHALPENTRIGIPLHGSCPSIHDGISQTKGSFVQTMTGLKLLLAKSCEIEIRIVVSKLNCRYLEDLANLIVSELHGIECVNIMGMELCGAAAKNIESLWIDYKDATKSAEGAINILVSHGIRVKLYNFPLCKVKRQYWALCVKSITDYKIRYENRCNKCAVKPICGGVFNTTLALTKMNLTPIEDKYNA